jgi:hypothetical protein
MIHTFSIKIYITHGFEFLDVKRPNQLGLRIFNFIRDHGRATRHAPMTSDCRTPTPDSLSNFILQNRVMTAYRVITISDVFGFIVKFMSLNFN